MASFKTMIWAAGLLAGLLACIGPASANSTPALPSLDASTSLLVVAPHPDDETLCCAGVIHRVIEAGGHVSIVWITSGDGSALSMLFTEKSLFRPVEKVHDLGRKRMLEARTAAGILGVDPTQLYFLGYPDGGIEELLWDYLKDGSTPRPAKFTGETRVPYSEALFPGHPYTGRSLGQDFAAVLDRVKPNLVLVPSGADTHADHNASGVLAHTVLYQRREAAKARYWIVHGGEGWPSPRGYMPGIPLNVPPRGAYLDEHEFALTDAEEDIKHQAIEAYHTQMQFMAPFLLAFVRTSELYTALATPMRPLDGIAF